MDVKFRTNPLTRLRVSLLDRKFKSQLLLVIPFLRRECRYYLSGAVFRILISDNTCKL